MLVMLREKGEISIHLIDTNGFYENTQNEMFIAVGCGVVVVVAVVVIVSNE